MTAKVTDPRALTALAALLAPALARVAASKKRTPAPTKASVLEVRDASARPPEAA